MVWGYKDSLMLHKGGKLQCVNKVWGCVVCHDLQQLRGCWRFKVNEQTIRKWKARNQDLKALVNPAKWWCWLETRWWTKFNGDGLSWLCNLCEAPLCDAQYVKHGSKVFVLWKTTRNLKLWSLPPILDDAKVFASTMNWLFHKNDCHTCKTLHCNTSRFWTLFSLPHSSGSRRSICSRTSLAATKLLFRLKTLGTIHSTQWVLERSDFGQQAMRRWDILWCWPARQMEWSVSLWSFSRECKPVQGFQDKFIGLVIWATDKRGADASFPWKGFRTGSICCMLVGVGSTIATPCHWWRPKQFFQVRHDSHSRWMHKAPPTGRPLL